MQSCCSSVLGPSARPRTRRRPPRPPAPPAGRESRLPPRVARSRWPRSPLARAFPCGSRARCRGSRGTSPRARPPARLLLCRLASTLVELDPLMHRPVSTIPHGRSAPVKSLSCEGSTRRERGADDEDHHHKQRQRKDCDQDFHSEPARTSEQGSGARQAVLGASARACATRRRTTLGAGQIAIRAPPTTIRPPSQIHITSGETIRWNWACGGLFM